MLQAVLPPQYFGSVYYYAVMAACDRVAIDTSLRYDKRYKSVHRCTVADTRGRLMLTVPVSRTPDCHISSWDKMLVSAHGQWWSDHIVSLESAYGRTPFFEFYIDRFKPWLADTGMPVTQMDVELDRVMRKALGLVCDVELFDSRNSGHGIPASEETPAGVGRCADEAGTQDSIVDLRRTDFSMPPDPAAFPGIPAIRDVPYYQVRADRLGFIPGLSILDLLFNMGPEAQVVLRDMCVGYQRLSGLALEKIRFQRTPP